MAKSVGANIGGSTGGTLGSNIINTLKNTGTNISNSYKNNPDMYKKIGAAMATGIGGLMAGKENRMRKADAIKASFYKNPYLSAAVGQPTDYSDYYADFMNNLYLSNLAAEAEKARQRGLIEADTNNWYNNYIKQQQVNPPAITSGGSGILGLDANEGTIA